MEVRIDCRKLKNIRELMYYKTYISKTKNTRMKYDRTPYGN